MLPGGKAQKEIARLNCPNCSTQLTITDRSGIEIDFCPQCRGVWLDRGELDKIVERSGKTPGQVGEKRKKREGFLGELFDF